MLVVEQHVSKVLKIADRAMVMRRGVVELEGTAAEMLARQAEIQASYLMQDPAGAHDADDPDDPEPVGRASESRTR